MEIDSNLMGRSFNMPNELMTATLTRESPWIGVGVSGSWYDYHEAMEAAGMDFYAVPQEAYTNMHDYMPVSGSEYPVVVPGIQVNVRPDKNEILGVVSSRYGLIQNEDAFSMAQPFLDNGGVIKAAGYTQQGLYFMVLRLHNNQILGDSYHVDVMITNSFNGAFPCAVIMVPTRIVCQNMYSRLMGHKDNILRYRHCSCVDERMGLMKGALGNVVAYMNEFNDTLQLAASNQLEDYQIWHLIHALFPYPQESKQSATINRIEEQREEFYNRYYLADDNANFKNTGLGFINAYYDYLSHREPGKKMQNSWQDRRLSGMVNGQDIKHKLIKEAIHA